MFDRVVPHTINRDFPNCSFFGTFYVAHLPFNPTSYALRHNCRTKDDSCTAFASWPIGPFTALMNGPTVPRFAPRNGPPRGNKRRMLFQITYEKEGAYPITLNFRTVNSLLEYWFGPRMSLACSRGRDRLHKLITRVEKVWIVESIRIWRLTQRDMAKTKHVRFAWNLLVTRPCTTNSPAPGEVQIKPLRTMIAHS